VEHDSSLRASVADRRRGDVQRTYDVRPSERGWEVVKRRGTILGTYASKETALQAARIVAEGNAPSEVRVHEPDGTSHIEWTFGEDPFTPSGSRNGS
jgi:hypothetical protein